METATNELPARDNTDRLRSGRSRLPTMNSTICPARTTPYAMANGVADPSKARGMHKVTTSSAAIAPKIANRTDPSSGSTTLVSHAYPTQAHHSVASTSTARAKPVQVGVAAIIAVHWVTASTKMRSKKSSSGVTCSPVRRTAVSRGREPWDGAPGTSLAGAASEVICAL